MSLLDRYKEERPLGKGAFGEVVLVKNKNDELFAIKKLNKKMLKDDSPFLEYLYGEIACMEELKVCPLVVRLEEKEITNDYIYLLLEYCNGGDLASLQSKQPGMVFKLNDAIEILVNVIRGLEDIHQHGYLHRDIKPGNVLVKENNGKTIFKIADFGFSKKIHEVNKTACGTEPFMAPEIFLKEDYDFPVDMWAFGILLYYMLNKEYPFSNFCTTKGLMSITISKANTRS